MTYNTNHPGFRAGEEFLGNVYELDDESKRRGGVAYDTRGNVLKYLFPVFIQKDDLATQKHLGQNEEK